VKSSLHFVLYLETMTTHAQDGKSTLIYEGGVSCCAAPFGFCRRTRYRITTTHVEKSSGFCCQRIDNLQLVRVKDVRYQDACCCCWFGCGNITLTSSDETNPVLVIAGIPGARAVYTAMRDSLDKIVAAARIELDDR